MNFPVAERRNKGLTAAVSPYLEHLEPLLVARDDQRHRVLVRLVHHVAVNLIHCQELLPLLRHLLHDVLRTENRLQVLRSKCQPSNRTSEEENIP
eukprot:1102464-Prorocentrum_minimum.AAC.1